MALYQHFWTFLPPPNKTTTNLASARCVRVSRFTPVFFSSSPQLKGASSQVAPWPSKGSGLLDRHQGFFLPNHLHITYMFLSSLTGYHCNLLESYAVEPQQRDPQVQPHFLPSFGWTAPIWTGVHGPVQPFLGGTGVRRFGVGSCFNTPINLVESRDKRLYGCFQK